MNRALRPPSPGIGGPSTAGAWFGCALAGLAGIAVVLVAVAGGLASLLAGQGWVWRAGWQPLFAVVAGDTARVWPGTPTALIVTLTMVLFGLLVTGAVAGGVALARHRHGRGDPSARALANRGELARLRVAEVTRTARRLRPSLTEERQLPLAQIGIVLGHLTRAAQTAVLATWEDVLLMFAAPRAGKTTAIAIPTIVAAPGPVMATSVKADVVNDSIGMRQRAGQVWVFDPQEIRYGYPQQMWVDLLAGIRNIEDARRLAAHFLQEIAAGGKDQDFWSNAALGLLSALIMAAAATGGDLNDVWRWVSDSTDDTPIDRLYEAGHTSVAAGLRGRMRGAFETKEGIFENARTAAQCLESDRIMPWITRPTRPLPRFDPDTFAASTDTLYLMSKDEAGAGRPLVAALVDQVMQAAIRTGETAGGRIDPPMTVVLDEAANICRIRDLPQLYSHLGSRGVATFTILQSYKQGESVWGETGMAMLWSAATQKLISAGIDDPRLSEDLSRLVGDHDVPVVSYSRDHRGHISESTQLRRQRILPPEDIRALERGTAVLLATGHRPAHLTLQPWFTGPYAGDIHATRVDPAHSEQASQPQQTPRP